MQGRRLMRRRLIAVAGLAGALLVSAAVSAFPQSTPADTGSEKKPAAGGTGSKNVTQGLTDPKNGGVAGTGMGTTDAEKAGTTGKGTSGTGYSVPGPPGEGVK